MDKMNTITFKDINLGGIADSKLQGGSNSVYKMYGFDLHSNPGFLRVNQKLKKVSGSLVDDIIQAIVPCSDGNTYLFAKTNGKIWKRTSAGVYSELAQTISGGVKSAYEFEGYIYYARQGYLGRVAVGNPTDFSTKNDTWGTFTNGNVDYHPMLENNLVLYIGDGNLLAQVDGGVFSADALDLSVKYKTKCLHRLSTNVLLGTYTNSDNVITQIFDWNTWSESFSYSDEISEKDINSFLTIDNAAICNCGTKGNLYYYDGIKLNLYKRIPGDYRSKTMEIKPDATCSRFGLPLFGVSNISGNPTECGIWSLGGYDANYKKVLNLEYGISTGNLENVYIYNITAIGETLIVTWGDNNGESIVYGVDELDTSNKIPEAYFISRMVNGARKDAKKLGGFIAYSELPTGCSIKCYYNKNSELDESGDLVWNEVVLTKDAIRSLYELSVRTEGCNTILLKVSALSSGNYSPEIEEADFYFE